MSPFVMLLLVIAGEVSAYVVGRLHGASKHHGWLADRFRYLAQTAPPGRPDDRNYSAEDILYVFGYANSKRCLSKGRRR